jgi:ribonuclease T1
MGHGLAFSRRINDTPSLGNTGLPAALWDAVSMSFTRSIKLALTGLVVASAVFLTGVQAKAPLQTDLQQTISLAELPEQGARIYARIHQGGPFTADKDGVIFANRERLLPRKQRGYYREYTVPTPGVSHRGVRRIVCGGERTSPEVCYYTADHYESFRRIQP